MEKAQIFANTMGVKDGRIISENIPAALRELDAGFMATIPLPQCRDSYFNIQVVLDREYTTATADGLHRSTVERTAGASFIELRTTVNYYLMLLQLRWDVRSTSAVREAPSSIHVFLHFLGH